jgi:hypothetical protein
MPKNTYANFDITLTSPFTVLAWVLPRDENGFLFRRIKSSSDYLYIKRKKDKDKLLFRGSISGDECSEKEGDNNSFLKGNP